jgi:hypothetical protein
MQLESSFDLLKSVVFDTKEPLDDANPFILNDAVVIKQRIKPSPPIVLEQQVIRFHNQKKASRIIKVDSLKVELS